jgi:hypothetical protein
MVPSNGRHSTIPRGSTLMDLPSLEDGPSTTVWYEVLEKQGSGIDAAAAVKGASHRRVMDSASPHTAAD